MLLDLVLKEMLERGYEETYSITPYDKASFIALSRHKVLEDVSTFADDLWWAIWAAVDYRRPEFYEVVDYVVHRLRAMDL